MPKYNLEMSDFIDIDFSLIGITCSIEDYRLAYFLNKNLNTNFKREETDLEIEIKASKHSFSIYSYKNLHYFNDWYLIANKYIKTEVVNQPSNLFSATNYNVETTNYLIPEQKKIDYFIKISGGIEADYYQNLITTIKSIQQVEAVFKINPDELKSIDFLIF